MNTTKAVKASVEKTGDDRGTTHSVCAPRILVFAHVPPPHHGQSQMVKFLVDGLSDGSRGVDIFHVNARFSSGSTDIGSIRIGKSAPLLIYVWKAWVARFRGGYSIFYYVPAPAKRSALYRDWLVMGLCRWAFPHMILHWHAVGLGRWISEEARPWERWLTQMALGRAAMSISLSRLTSADAALLGPRRQCIVHNGITDPVPNYAIDFASIRKSRQEAIRDALQQKGGHETEVSVLFLALCSRDKGVFDALQSVQMANRSLEQHHCAVRFRLVVAGEFVNPGDRAEFDGLNCLHPVATVHGFLDGPGKETAFRSADLFLFPTFYANEGQPLNLVEAMAWGLPIVTTRWRAIPELLPEGYPGIAEPADVEGIARLMVRLFDQNHSQRLRRQFEEKFTIDRHLDAMAAALRRSTG